LVTFLKGNANFNVTYRDLPNFNGKVTICDKPKTTVDIIASDLGTNKNANSMVMSLRISNRKKMLFLGDFETKNAYNNLLWPLDNYVDEISDHPILMVPHHGSNKMDNPNVRFNNYVNPTFAIVSSAIWSKLMHPQMETLQGICHGHTLTDVFADNVIRIGIYDSPMPLGWIEKSDNNDVRRLVHCDVNIYQTTEWGHGNSFGLYKIVSKISATTTIVTTNLEKEIVVNMDANIL